MKLDGLPGCMVEALDPVDVMEDGPPEFSVSLRTEFICDDRITKVDAVHAVAVEAIDDRAVAAMLTSAGVPEEVVASDCQIVVRKILHCCLNMKFWCHETLEPPLPPGRSVVIPILAEVFFWVDKLPPPLT